MIVAPVPVDEVERLAALIELRLLDSEPEEVFDSLTRLASALLGVPIAVVSLVDASRQWFKSRVGLEATETSRDVAFCAHAILGDEPFVVPDARVDKRFSDNPLVLGAPSIRAYAGVPLRTTRGHAIGTLCAIDQKPRQFTEKEISLLKDLAAIAQREIMHRETAAGAQRVVDVATELERTKQTLEALNREQQLMLDNELVGIMKMKERRATWVSPALERLFGYETGELDGQPSRVLYLDDASHASVGAQAYSALARGERFRTQMQMVRKPGDIVWMEISGAALSDQTDESLWMMQDITARKLYQQKVEELAFHDASTGLPNRRLLDDRLFQALRAAERANQHVAICFIDLDGFKPVNDRFGHDAGDRLLCEVALRLGAAVRSNDTVARVGGDEFVLMLTQLATQEEADAIVERACASVAKPFEVLAGQDVHVTASVGVAYGPIAGLGLAELIARADTAMYKAKRRRKEAANRVS